MPPRKRSPANARQLSSPAYRLAALDQEFLLADARRGLRFHLEYEKAEEALRAWGIRSTIVVFGSARIRENGGSDHARWYKAARAFAAIASARGGAMDRDHDGQRDNVIATGGGGGIMEAANRGATDVGAPSIGFNIRLPAEQEPNAWSTPELTFQFHYFAMRKMHFAMRTNGLVIFPGGFGTCDELFEMLTLDQTGKGNHAPIVLYDEAYWRAAINFQHFVDHGMISKEDLSLFDYASSPEETWQKLLDRGLQATNGPLEKPRPRTRKKQKAP